MSGLSATVKLLHRIPIRDGTRVIYRHVDDRPYDPQATTVYVNADDFLDLGSPDEITVTIQPGDQLNNEDPGGETCQTHTSSLATANWAST